MNCYTVAAAAPQAQHWHDTDGDAAEDVGVQVFLARSHARAPVDLPPAVSGHHNDAIEGLRGVGAAVDQHAPGRGHAGVGVARGGRRPDRGQGVPAPGGRVEQVRVVEERALRPSDMMATGRSKQQPADPSCVIRQPDKRRSLRDRACARRENAAPVCLPAHLQVLGGLSGLLTWPSQPPYTSIRFAAIIAAACP